jgi:hypothetical protein
MTMTGPILTGLRGTKITGSISYTLVNYTTSDVVSNASKPPTFNGRVIGVEKIPTPCAKLPKTMETFF